MPRSALLAKVRNISELQDLLQLRDSMCWDDPNKNYETRREKSDLLIGEIRQEKESNQLDRM